MERFKLILTKQKDERWFCRVVDELDDNILDDNGNGIESCLNTPKESILAIIDDIKL